jgi:hypothetical protein
LVAWLNVNILEFVLVGYMQHRSGYLILMLVRLPHTYKLELKCVQDTSYRCLQ